MKILIVDTETTGLDADSEVCELAATLYEIGDFHCGALASASTLIAINRKNKACGINRISNSLAFESQPIYPKIIESIAYLASQANYATSFNADFDKPYWSKIINLPWVCAQTDFQWNYPKEHFKLIELALWLGVGVSSAHRAADDVRLLVECFDRVPNLSGKFDYAIERAESPWVELQALVDYQDRELAKDAKFIWDAHMKKWLKKVKECDREAFVAELDFKVGVTNAV